MIGIECMRCWNIFRIMIENLETLLTLARTGTMMEASTELRITQSAVSKRISSLERYYSRKLIQKKGRRVELTQHGQRLVDKVTPLLSEPVSYTHLTLPTNREV